MARLGEAAPDGLPVRCPPAGPPPFMSVYARRPTAPAEHKARELYAPRPLSSSTELGKLLLALELPLCSCPLPELPEDPDSEIRIPGYRILFLAFRKTCEPDCPRALALQRLSARWPASRAEELLGKLIHTQRQYDAEGYEPDLVWRSPVWLRAKSGRRLDVGRGVHMASQQGWAAVYRVRAANRLPLYHPDDENPRNHGEWKASLQGDPGNRQGEVIDERSRKVRVRVRKGEEPGWLDWVLIRWQEIRKVVSDE